MIVRGHIVDVLNRRMFDGEIEFENGKIVLSGTGTELAQSDSIKKAYLGG